MESMIFSLVGIGRFLRAGALGLMVFGAPLLRADVLVNSDFSQGRAHWGGDAEEVTATDLKTGDADSTAVTIKLKKDKWTMIYQGFTVREPVLYYTIVFRLSKDYKLAGKDGDDTEAGDFSSVPGIMQLYDVPPAHWTLFYTGTDPTDAGSIKTKHFDPESKPGKIQTLSGKLINLAYGADANLILAFPPGKGSVTLKLLQLSPKDPDAQP